MYLIVAHIELPMTYWLNLPPLRHHIYTAAACLPFFITGSQPIVGLRVLDNTISPPRCQRQYLRSKDLSTPMADNIPHGHL